MPLLKYIFALLRRLLFLSLFLAPQLFAQDNLIPQNLLSIINEAQNAPLNSSPFKVTHKLNGNILDIAVKLDAGSYIYKDSLSLSLTDGGQAYFTKVPPSTEHIDVQGTHEVFFDKADIKVQIVSAKEGSMISFSFQGCDGLGICYPPQSVTVSLPQIDPDSALLNDNASNEGTDTTAGKLSTTLSSDFIFGLILCFILGIGLDLTPCVLPMLPVFSAMIAGQNTVNNSQKLASNCAYLLGLCLTYTLLGLLFSFAGASLHGLLQSPYTAYALAAFLIICALSCAGFFTLSLSQGISSALQGKLSALKMTGVPAAFIFGLISALITTPCTSAPLAGALLFILKEGDLLKGTAAFFCIGLGMGAPLFIIGVLGGKFILKARAFSAVIFKLMAIPLVLAALYIVEGYLGDYASHVRTTVIILSCLYCSLILYKSKLYPVFKGTIYAVCTVIAIFYAVTSFNPPSGKSLPFTEIKSLNDLNITTDKALLVVGAKWCANCRQMENEIFTSERFKNSTSGMQLLHFDITDSSDPDVQEFMKQYSLIGVPYTALLDRNGKVITDAIGYLDFAEFDKRFLSK